MKVNEKYLRGFMKDFRGMTCTVQIRKGVDFDFHMPQNNYETIEPLIGQIQEFQQHVEKLGFALVRVEKAQPTSQCVCFGHEDGRKVALWIIYYSHNDGPNHTPGVRAYLEEAHPEMTS